MRVYLFYFRIMALGCLVLLTHCQGRNADFQPVVNSETESAVASPAPSAATPSASKCDNGQAPKVISGDCSGVWSVRKTEGALNCEFEWKPRVSCPAGMKPLGLQSACYGVTVRPAEGNTNTSEGCLAAYGKHPISPAYKLECCP